MQYLHQISLIVTQQFHCFAQLCSSAYINVTSVLMIGDLQSVHCLYAFYCARYR